MLDEEFNKDRARLVRDLAAKADPFVKKRLLDLLARYEGKKTSRRLPLPSIDGDKHADDKHGGTDT
jgi:hypothetical protein